MLGPILSSTIAAFAVPGPLDIIGRDGRGHGGRPIGALHDNLDTAIRLALDADRSACVAEARFYDWEHCTDLFVAGLAVRAAAATSRTMLVAA